MWWTLSTVFSPASLLFRQAKLFYAAVDVNSLLHCLCLFSSRNSRAWIKLRRSKSSGWIWWNTDKEMKSRREERVKLVIFLAHGCNYTLCIPEAFLWILCRSACLSWERGRKREEKSLSLGDGMSALSILFLGRLAFWFCLAFLIKLSCAFAAWLKFISGELEKGICKENFYGKLWFQCLAAAVFLISRLIARYILISGFIF